MIYIMTMALTTDKIFLFVTTCTEDKLAFVLNKVSLIKIDTFRLRLAHRTSL